MNRYLEVATEAAKDAGALLLRYAARGVKVSYKHSPNDFVTEADTASQALVRERLTSAFPDFRFVGEEDGLNDAQVGELLASLAPGVGCWIVDPLDGTTNFVRGIHGYCVSIGLYMDGGIVAGVIYCPVEDELFYAAKGEGAYLNGHPIHVSDCDAIERAFVVCGIPPVGDDLRRLVMARVDKVAIQAFNLRMVGSAAREIAYVAAGKFDCFWEIGPHPWDVAAGIALVSEAGGVITTADGAPYAIGNPSMLFSAPGVAKALAAL